MSDVFITIGACIIGATVIALSILYRILPIVGAIVLYRIYFT